MCWGRSVTDKTQRISINQGHFKEQSGFGLVESFFSIVLLAGFLLSACHLLLNLFSSKLLDQTAAKLVHSFNKARQIAIETNTSIQIKAVDNSWANGWEVIALDASTNSPAVHKQEQLEEPVIFVGNQQQSIIFKANGMASNLNPLGDSGLIFCNSNGKGRKLTMLASGRVQVTNIKQECGVSS